MPVDSVALEFANTVTGVVPWIIGIFIIVAIVLIIAKWRGQKEEDDLQRPPIIIPEDKYIEQQKTLMRIQGRKINHRSALRFGMHEVCLVKRWTHFYISEKEKIDLSKFKKKSEMEEIKELLEGKEYHPESHYILETVEFGFFNAIMYFLGYRMKYMIIPKQYVKIENSQNWNCDDDLYGKPYFDRVFIFTKAGQKHMEDFHDNLTLKQVLRAQVNYIPQMQYHDYVTGKFAAKSREFHDAKKKDWKEREENLEKEVNE